MTTTTEIMPNNAIKFMPFESGYHYTENSQSISLRMAFCNKIHDKYMEMFLPVSCRDYFSDVIHAEYWKIPVGPIYGFIYDGTRQHIDRDKIRLSIHCHSQSDFAHIKENCLQILNPLEQGAGFEKSVLLFPPKKVLIIEGDAKWQSNTYLLSIYTLILRISGILFTNPENWLQEFIINKEKLQCNYSNDFQYFIKFPHFQKSLQKLDQIAQYSLQHPEQSPSGWSRDTPIEVIHGFAGIWGIRQKTIDGQSELNEMVTQIVGKDE